MFDTYDPGDFYDELFTSRGVPRPEAELLVKRISNISIEELMLRQQMAQNMLFRLGVTFNVYSDNQGTERIFPFDMVPRVVPSQEWQWLER
ncbi:MAG: circularly permuted type 2 ATP-grasp protein, partial [Cyanobacteria bacterium P01_D01_bin.2]